MAFYKIKSGRVTGARGVLDYTGEQGHLFYSQDDNVLRISDGHTLGGIPLSGGSITFISIGAPPNPLEGQLWWNTVDGRLYIWYDNNWVDASPESNVAEDNDTGYTTTATVKSLIANSLTNYVTQSFITGLGYTTTATVTDLIANSLTNYATQLYVNSQGFITTAALAGYATETWVTNHNYLQVETGVHSVTGTANQVIVTDLGNRDIQLSTPQNLNSTATVTFANLTVTGNTNLGNLTYQTTANVDGYRIYLASTSTSDAQIDGGGIVLGTSTWTTGIVYSLPDNYWYTMDSAGFQTEHLVATKTTVSNLTVLNNADIGYSNLKGQFANALLQIDAASDTYSQVNFQNHSSSTWASGDFVVTNDIGTDGQHFIDMGINSSRWSTSSWVINGANDGYLYIDSGNLAIGTTATEIVTFIGPTDTADSIISVANATTITYSVDLVPSADAVYNLGSPSNRWRSAYVGTGSLYIEDVSLQANAELTVDNGILFINGISGLRVGNIQITPTGLTTNIGSQNITIGSPGDTGYVETYRGIQYSNGSLQTIAWNSTATVLWNQITNVPGFTTTASVQTLIANSLTNFVYTGTVAYNQITGTPAIGVTSITTGTGIRVDHSTGTVNISFANDGGYITSAALATYATQTYVNSQGFITSSALSPYTPTSGLGTIIANSLTNYATQTYVTTRGYITTASLSVTTAASGTSALSYLNGVFTYTPPNLSAYLTTVTNVAYANTATNLVGGIGVASLVGSSGTSVSTSTGAVTVWFNTGTLVTTAVTANSVAGGYVSSITAGTGTQVSTSTGAVTIWTLPAQAITTTATSTSTTGLTVDLSGPTFITWQPTANGTRTITLTGFTPGRKVEMFITPHAANDVFTVSGVTTGQCSNNKNTFTMNGVGASAQTSFILQIYCTTNAIGGVWIYGNGSL